MRPPETGGAGSGPSSLELALLTVERVGACEHCTTLRFTGPPMACVVCGGDAEPSAVGTPTCSITCTGQLADKVLPGIADALHAHPLPGVEPTPTPKPKPRLRPLAAVSSLEGARERVGDVRAVLERHGVTVRGKLALCPVHAEKTPSMSLYSKGEKSRAHCHGCGWDGDSLDLEAALAGEDLATTIRRWSA